MLLVSYNHMAFFCFVIIIISIIITISFISVIGIYSIYKEAIKKKRSIDSKCKMIEHNYDKLYENYIKSCEVYHDYKTHIMVITYLAKDDNKKDLLKYISDLEEPFYSLDNIIWTGNKVVDMILNYKIYEAKEKTIELKYSIENICFADSMKEIDFCAIISNLLNNAIESCELIKDNRKWINFSMKKANDMIAINIENSIAIKPVMKNGQLQSMKNNKILHGIGLKCVKEIVKKHNGFMEYNFNDNIFYLDLTLNI